MWPLDAGKARKWAWPRDWRRKRRYASTLILASETRVRLLTAELKFRHLC